MASFRSKSLDRLFEAVLRLQSVDECYNFFEDICTINEVQDMAQRFDVALMLDEGRNYQTIAKEANVSTATISRVSRCLNYGSGGYRSAIDKLKGKETLTEEK
ncbi:MAG: helix-turn-helix domain-containing protein [Oscillospiraceae bacterium]|nr:helix-turn-helix domain-containing protein [Oscillospiraceae bacterium]MBQ4544302.1 helix-turn-helix domain-containing protein [Oscillospiraceae bacterium]MBQ6902281.1 helix-turn-helix domain-containing protein [Oscillospiraceae bacterium]